MNILNSKSKYRLPIIFLIHIFTCQKKEVDKLDDALKTPEGYIHHIIEPQVPEEIEGNTNEKLAVIQIDSKVNIENKNLIYSLVKELDIIDFTDRVKAIENKTTNKDKLAPITIPLNRMKSASKYMVLIYNENNNFLPELYKQLISGGTTATVNNSISINARNKYSYVAFSYDTKKEIDSYIINPSEQQVQTDNYDFMYVNGIIDPLSYKEVNEKNNPKRSNLILEKKLSKINFTYDIRYIYTCGWHLAPLTHDISLEIIKSQSDQNNPLLKGVFDLKARNFKSHTYYTNNIDFIPIRTSARNIRDTFNDYSTTTVYS